MAGGVIPRKKTKRKRAAKQEQYDPDRPVTQLQFAEMVGKSQQYVSRLAYYEVLPRQGTLRDWNRAYIRFLMGAAYGRGGWTALAKIFERADTALDHELDLE